QDAMTASPTASFRDAVAHFVGSILVVECRERLTAFLWSLGEQPTLRIARALPSLLAESRQADKIAELLISRTFMAAAVGQGATGALISAIRLPNIRSIVLSRVDTAIRNTAKRSTHEESNWLLDLAILLGRSGEASVAAVAAGLAFNMRSVLWPAGHFLLLVAAIEASNSALEAGSYADAEHICRSFLHVARTSSVDNSEIYARRKRSLECNLAGALIYQSRHDEAEELIQRLLPILEAAGENYQCANLYLGLVVIRSDQRDYPLAIDY